MNLSKTEVTVGTAVRVLRLSKRTVIRMCESGKLRARRLGEFGWWRIDYDSLIDVKQNLEEALPLSRRA